MIDWPGTRLRPLGQADLASLHEWQNDPQLREQTMGFRGPVQHETVAGWLRGLATETLRSRVVFGIQHGEDLAGLVQLHGIEWIDRSALLGLHLGAGRHRGHGLGHIAASLLLDYAFNGLGLLRVSLTTLAGNGPAIRLYERLGFQREGTFRSARLVAGRREDVAAYAILAAEWCAMPPPAANRLVHGGLMA